MYTLDLEMVYSDLSFSKVPFVHRVRSLKKIKKAYSYSLLFFKLLSRWGFFMFSYCYWDEIRSFRRLGIQIGVELVLVWY